jgi:hypothetical protein
MLQAAAALLEIVGEVARHAARRDPDPLKDPATVTQSAWDSARHLVASRYGLPPRAHEVCRQLCDYEGKPWQWADLLKTVLDPHQDPQTAWAKRLSIPDVLITEDHVAFAIKFVACRLGMPSLIGPRQYEKAREELLRQFAAVRGSATALEERLPARTQIEIACGSWRRALEVASDPSGSPSEQHATSPR